MKKKINYPEKRQFRLSAAEGGKLRAIAATYAGGDQSRWIRYAIFSAPRKMLKKNTPASEK